MNDIQKIESLFPFVEDQYIYVHIYSFDWNSIDYFGPVYLCIEDTKILMNYYAYGNHGGIPVLALTPIDSNYSSVEDVMSAIGTNMSNLYLERCCPVVTRQ